MYQVCPLNPRELLCNGLYNLVIDSPGIRAATILVLGTSAALIGTSQLLLFLAIAVTGALAFIQFARPSFVARAFVGGLGGATWVWLVILFLPHPTSRTAGHAVAYFVTSAMAVGPGALIGLVYQAFARWLIRAEPPQHPFRFSLRGLGIAVSVLSVVLAGSAYRLRQYERERELASVWAPSGIGLGFDYWSRPEAAWTTQPNATFDDTLLEQLTELGDLRSVSLIGTQVTDAGLVHLQRLPNLRQLNLGSLPITDAGAAHLQSIPSLRHVALTGTKVSQDGVANLATNGTVESIAVTAPLVQPTLALIESRGLDVHVSDECEFP